MNTSDDLKNQVKHLLVDNLMLQVSVDQIGNEDPLFGPGGPGLDSVDALQLVVALEKNYGLKIPDPETARTVLLNVDSITAAIEAHQAKQTKAQ